MLSLALQPSLLEARRPASSLLTCLLAGADNFFFTSGGWLRPVTMSVDLLDEGLAHYIKSFAERIIMSWVDKSMMRTEFWHGVLSNY